MDIQRNPITEWGTLLELVESVSMSMNVLLSPASCSELSHSASEKITPTHTSIHETTQEQPSVYAS